MYFTVSIEEVKPMICIKSQTKEVQFIVTEQYFQTSFSISYNGIRYDDIMSYST